MHVRRQRRRVTGGPSGLLGVRASRRTRIIAAGAATLAIAGGGIAQASTDFFGTDQVGQTTDKGLVVSSDQYLNPIGSRLVINNGKIMSSSVSPDGTHLAASVTDGGMALAIVDLKDYKVQQLVGNNAKADLRISGNDVGQEGPTYSPDGKQLWLGQINGYRRFTVNADGSLADPTFVSIPADGPKRALVGEAAFSADGKTVYSAVNGQNRVVAIDAASGTIQHSWAVGIAPRDLAMVGNKLYVSNEGGRPAEAGETTLNSYNTQVPTDPKTAATTTGTVSVIDLANPAADATSIDVGLHPTALYAKNGALFVTNTNSDTVSVIDTSSGKVVQTIATQPWPEAKVGYEPDAVTLTDDGHLLVTLGRANAVAVYRYTKPLEPVSYVGLLPTDYFPSEITTAGDDVLVSNTRGIDARRPNNPAGHATHDTTSSLQRFTLPNDNAIHGYTAKVFKQNGWIANSLALSAGKGGVAPVPVPVRLGDPSTIKHVFLIVKENHSYDQFFGDISQGNGDSSLTQYGENVTPNQHALAKQFGLYDNAYDVATNSAEGHNWIMQADNPEYSESSAGEYQRSYTTSDDALGHQRTGFLWTAAQAAGKTVRDFNEFQQYLTKPAGSTWQDFYCDARNMEKTGQDTTLPTYSSAAIPSLNDVTAHDFPGWDLSIPDIYRYEMWKKDFQKNGPAELNIMALINDHTGGPLNPAAQVADNDLALGRIVDTISHSKYWKDTAIFVVEDDTQDGLDHIDGHRAPVQVISPWAQHGTVDNHYYTQITMIRTIEQILGIHPMNQKDSAATPMASAFNDKPDNTPFNTVPNHTSLTLGLKTPPSCGEDVVASQYAKSQPSTTVPAGKKDVASKWATWKAKQHFTGTLAKADSANPEQMNHFTWYQTHGWIKPYPGETKIYAPDQVPGAYIPPTDTDN
ncbi:40-residue YVTN family beta-propeller repeat-containing protein [Actinopolymorpha cephalotaxi]|uniref:40-residue YVTN family beta-propeller repeat-containing protein n=1 Tax=Actinopolymorpha cephalotaxi TaxID=504797 RepID=A0A1I2SW94_9ACTN|nr:bifunctional YncE family protein/alkaline phosphatase family protein [Actinopolymorpha cephalotaxi]NYH84039.1 YVTN family beta-propeller protein [Actinopolymorpha cephalotaxi]SFG54201.1 40-residue YVTN family beta-propeller repeat-containing protein [Actinopolymorpha cephalotaxi]